MRLLNKFCLQLGIAFLLCASSITGLAQVNIGYPSDILVRPGTDGSEVLFCVSVNDRSIASFHVTSDLTGEQHYGGAQAGHTDGNPFGGGPFVITYFSGQWIFSADGPAFGWQSDANHDLPAGYKFIFKVQNPNFNANTKFSYSFDRVPDHAGFGVFAIAVMSLTTAKVIFGKKMVNSANAIGSHLNS